MKNKKQMRENVISVVLASSIVVCSFFNFIKQKKNKEVNKTTNSNTSISSYQEDNVSETTYIESTIPTINEEISNITYNNKEEDLVSVNNINTVSTKRTSEFFEELNNINSIYNYDLPEDIVPEVTSTGVVCSTKYNFNRNNAKDLYDNMVIDS